MERRRVWRLRITRDLVLFLTGLAILGHQAFAAAQVQAELVAAAVALLIGPAVARVDDAVKDRRQEQNNDHDR